MRRFLERAGSGRGVDLESWEFGIRQAVLSAGARLLEQLVDGVGSGRRDAPVLCECGVRMESRGCREKVIKTILGEISFRRSLFVCPECGAGRFPGDELLDVVGTMFSPGVRRLMARAGQRDTFREGRDDLLALANIRVTAKDVERVSESTGAAIELWQRKERERLLSDEQEAKPIERIRILYVSYDGTGVPMVPWATAGRKGKQPDGKSKTREAKLGCVFTQTTTDEEGRPVRDAGSTTFVGAIETSEAFGYRIFGEALRRGMEYADKVVVLADGARYNWEIAALHFPGAIQIVDLYHAREHMYLLCGLLIPQAGKERFKLEMRWRTMLDEGRVVKIIEEAEARLPRSEVRRSEAQSQVGYFMHNQERMRYGEYRGQGLFVGSGVIEAGCGTIVGKRLKQPGMEWSEEGANDIVALRCCHLSGRMEEFWEQRAPTD